MANCPDKQLLNALVVRSGGNFPMAQSVQERNYQNQSNDHAASEEEAEECEGASLGAYQFTHSCNAVIVEQEIKAKGKDEIGKAQNGKGLMYLDVKINGKPIRAMVDTGATHNYLASTEVERLGLVLEKGVGRVKAINSAAQPVAGLARSVPIRVGPYEGRTSFSAVVMDDFKVILGLEFLRETNASVMPCTNSLMMMGKTPCVIPMMTPSNNGKFLSAIQLKKGLKHENPTFVAALKWDEIQETSGPLPSSICHVLKEYEDVMRTSCQRSFPLEEKLTTKLN